MTSINLDAPSASGPPSLRYESPGDHVVVGIVDVGEYQQTDYDTDEPVFWNDDPTKPKMGKVVTGLVVSATPGATVRDPEGATSDDRVPVTTGSLVTFWCEGGTHYTWQDAVKAAKGANVGDVMKWEFDHEEPPRNPKHKPRKVQVAVIRRPEAKDGDLADRCVEKYHELKARPAVDAVPFDDNPAYKAPAASEF